MSYARFSEGDIYLFGNMFGGWDCSSCRLNQVDDWYGTSALFTIEEVYDHVLDHIRAGHKVPRRCLIRVCKEYEEQLDLDDELFQDHLDTVDGFCLDLKPCIRHTKDQDDINCIEITQNNLESNSERPLVLSPSDLEYIYHAAMKIINEREIRRIQPQEEGGNSHEEN